MDFIIMPFDINYRVSIGKLNSDGTLDINIPEFSDIKLPANVSNGDLFAWRYTIDFKCADRSSLKTSESLKAFDGGYFA